MTARVDVGVQNDDESERGSSGGQDQQWTTNSGRRFSHFFTLSVRISFRSYNSAKAASSLSNAYA
jgi:hypothetical protein